MAPSPDEVVSENRKNQILSRFDKIPTHNHATILLVGAKDIGINAFVETINTIDTAYSLQIHTTTSLPLPKDDDRPRIDYIVFMIDLTNYQSFTMIKEAVSFVDVDYFLGHSCFVLSKAKQEYSHTVDIEEVFDFIGNLNTLFMCGDFEKSSERLNIIKRILHNVEISCGFCKVHSMVVQATRQYLHQI